MTEKTQLVRWVAIVVAAVGLLAVAAVDSGGAETDAERIQRLSDSFACPQCQGESVSESSAAVAATIRGFIADEVAAGATDEEIRDDLVAGYGARVLLTPPAEGIASLVWILPVVVLTAAAAAAAAVFAGRDRVTGGATDADRELVERARDERARAEATEVGDG
jgi:cytochrome c-type biogenesis protein CcmH